MTTVASKVQVWEKCSCDLLCLPSPTVNECWDNETDIIWTCTLACVYEGCMCRVCVSNIAEKREEVCVECSRASCPYETKGDFFFFLPFWRDHARLRNGTHSSKSCFLEVCNSFFASTAPFGRGSHVLPYLDSRVTWVYSWIRNRNKKKGITKTWHLLTRLKQQVWSNRRRERGKQQKGTSGAWRTEE